MNFEDDYPNLVENAFFVHEHKVRFVITKINSIIRSVDKDVSLYEYNDYCKEVYNDVKKFANEFKDKFSESVITPKEQLSMLLNNLVERQVDKKIGENGFNKWFIDNKSTQYSSQVEYFKKEYF